MLVAVIWLSMRARSIPDNAGDFFSGHNSIGRWGLLSGMLGGALTGIALTHAADLSGRQGIAVFAMLSVASGLVGSGVMLVVGLRVWTLTRRSHVYTQGQYIAARFGSRKLALALAVVFSLLLLPCLAAALAAAGGLLSKLTQIPPGIAAGAVGAAAAACIWFGGLRATSRFVNMAAVVLLAGGVLATLLVARHVNPKPSSLIGNIRHATESTEGQPATRHLLVMGVHPEDAKQYASDKLAHEQAQTDYATSLSEWELAGKKGAEPKIPVAPSEPKPTLSHVHFLSALLLPLALGVLPPMFMVWAGARSPEVFSRAIIAHPIVLAVLWLPCVLMGIWAAGAAVGGGSLAMLLTQPPAGSALATVMALWIIAGACVCVAPMLMSLGTLVTHDLVLAMPGREHPADSERIDTARYVVVGAAALAVMAAALAHSERLAHLAGWCVSAFAALFPIMFAALYWPRATVAGVGAAAAAALLTGVLLDVKAKGAAATDPVLFGLLPVAPMIAASTAALLLVSRFTSRPADELLRRHFGGQQLAGERPSQATQSGPNGPQRFSQAAPSDSRPQHSQQQPQQQRPSGSYGQQRPNRSEREGRDGREGRGFQPRHPGGGRPSRDSRDGRDGRDSRGWRDSRDVRPQQRPSDSQTRPDHSQRPGTSGGDAPDRPTNHAPQSDSSNP